MSVPGTIWDLLVGAAEGEGPGLTLHTPDGSEHLRPSELVERARAAGAALVEAGVAPGEAVGILGHNRVEWPVWAAAAWSIGAAVVPLPFAHRVVDRTAATTTLGALIATAGCRVVVAEPRLAGLLDDVAVLAWDAVGSGRLRTSAGAPSPAAGDVAVIQFTSGSTAHPKPAVLTHRAVVATMESQRATLPLASLDKGLLGWAPFFHDLGLFGYLVRPLALGVAGHVLATDRFAPDPAEWFRLATRVGAGETIAPSSGWAAALRGALRDSGGIDLSAYDLAIHAAETIDPAVVDRLRGEGARLGLRSEAVLGAYGLAEVTLGASVDPADEGLVVEEVDLARLSAGHAVSPGGAGARRRRVASCGTPMAGVTIDVRAGEGGDGAGDGVVGPVWVRAASAFSGYLVGGAVTGGPVDGWVDTGDLGYLRGGRLYVTGRAKDLIVVLGRNYAPDDVEWAAESVEGVRAGRSVAFTPPGVDGEVVVVVEPSSAGRPEVELTRAVRDRVFGRVGLSVRHVVVVPPGTVPKTTSGKRRRGAVAAAYAAGELG